MDVSGLLWTPVGDGLWTSVDISGSGLWTSVDISGMMEQWGGSASSGSAGVKATSPDQEGVRACFGGVLMSFLSVGRRVGLDGRVV